MMQLLSLSGSSEAGAATHDKDEQVVAGLYVDEIQEVRNVWQFFRGRRPETYQDIVNPL